MNWPVFYLVCFGLGFTLSLLSFLSGAFHVHLPFRLHTHWAHAGTAGHVGGAVRGGMKAGRGASWINSAAVLAFLAWFGGVGYLLTTRYRIWYLAALGFATLAGIVGGAGVSWFFVDFLLKHETSLDDADYRLDGMVGRITVPIRAGGTGEMVFTQAGVRRVSGARSDSGAPIEKGAEVVIARYERGIAYVRRWEEFTS